MNELTSILGVTAMFLLRVGLPIVLLVILGIAIDRWQTKREERIRKYYAPTQDKIISSNENTEGKEEADQSDSQIA